jgi:hypothetical protein
MLTVMDTCPSTVMQSRRRRPPFRSRPHQRRRVSAMCLSASLSRRHKPACPAARPISGRRSAATSDGRHGVRAPSRCAAAWHASIARPRGRGTRTDARPTVQVGALTSVKTYFSGATSSTRRQLQGRFRSLPVAFRPLSSLTHLSLGKVHVHERERRAEWFIAGEVAFRGETISSDECASHGAGQPDQAAGGPARGLPKRGMSGRSDGRPGRGRHDMHISHEHAGGLFPRSGPPGPGAFPLRARPGCSPSVSDPAPALIPDSKTFAFCAGSHLLC